MQRCGSRGVAAASIRRGKRVGHVPIDGAGRSSVRQGFNVLLPLESRRCRAAEWKPDSRWKRTNSVSPYPARPLCRQSCDIGLAAGSRPASPSAARLRSRSRFALLCRRALRDELIGGGVRRAHCLLRRWPRHFQGSKSKYPPRRWTSSSARSTARKSLDSPGRKARPMTGATGTMALAMPASNRGCGPEIQAALEILGFHRAVVIEIHDHSLAGLNRDWPRPDRSVLFRVAVSW